MTHDEQFPVGAAARNNAEWCAAMCRAHGLRGVFGTLAWTAPARTPPFYPDAVTLGPGADADAVLAGVDTLTPGASVKDSFADLDLAPAGFRVLFEARWIHRPPGPPAVPTDLLPGVAADPAALRGWALAREEQGDSDLFVPRLLDDPATSVLVGRSGDGRVAAGAVATLGAGVVGLSNVFAREGGPDAAWAFALTAAHRLLPELPVVGYEHGEDLDAALRHGCRAIGPLRIWLHAP
ncbi:hypothetical protein ACGFS9_01515 [Streptomyces sp. NPDC048566]|uniref:hypothetical protein n=1 Tax=Streptomyces sp. NPDC048566 TaxID=3365569 RepID=UPI00370FF69F